ncbi:MAG TPA: glycosyltransferase family 39 protein [Bryobacteraceae bacterium]|nr:glycosyltransferase family 39 protein [Bryobacteraceae bacterium]
MRTRFWTAGRIVMALAFAKLLFHLATFRGYGIFRDELYYLACGRHLAFGYVEFPPLIGVLTRAITAVLGDSLFAVRLLPAMAGAGVVVLTAAIARELGGGRFAQALAGLAVIVAPAWMSIDHFMNTNAFDPLFWGGCAWMAIRAWNTGDSRYWLGFGVVAGVGLENKHAMLFFGFGVVAGLLLTARRRDFAQRNLWLGGLIAALLFLPNVIWEIRLGWPTLEFLQNAVKYKNALLTPGQFLTTQLQLTVAAVPVWLAGLWFFFFHPRGKAYRALGWTFVVVGVTLWMLHGKGYYLLPAYPMLLGAGGVLLEESLALRRWQWARPALVALMLVLAALSAPLAVPVLPVETFVRYAAWLGIKNPVEERHKMGRLPQFYADMFGWRNMAEQVAKVFHELPAEDQGHTAILTQNYGEAGAIDYYGPSLRIPNAISGHNNYWLWGPPPVDPQVVIVVGGGDAGLQRVFGDVRAAGMIHDPNAMPFENGLAIWVCREPKVSLRSLWPKLKHYV